MYTITTAITSERTSTGASILRRLVPLAPRATISLSPESRPEPDKCSNSTAILEG